MLTTIFLVTVIAASSIIACSRYSWSQAIEISLPPIQEITGRIYIDYTVSNPGFYSLKAGDTVETLIQAAGGTTGNADLNQLKLYIPQTEKEESSQKFNINRAEVWLLEALPGIGEARAQDIVAYRQQNGPFNNTYELTEVVGIGITTYEEIKDWITVTD